MNRGFLRTFAMIAGCLLLCGCVVEKEIPDGGVSFGYAWWVSVLAIFGGIGAILGGLAIIKSQYGWILLAGGAFFAIVWGPASFIDHVTIAPDGFRSAGGFWGFSSNDIKFAEMSGITYSKEQKSGRRGRKYDVYSVTMNRKSGEPVKMEIDNLMEEAGLPLIMFARINSVPFTDATGEFHSSDEIDQMILEAFTTPEEREQNPAPDAVP